jgi:glycosyltransferase involved in cell wall biosynthesis
MNIIHIITRLNLGGSEEQTTECCNYQVRCGHTVTLFYGEEACQEAIDKLDPRITARQVPSLVWGIEPLNDLRAWRILKDLIAQRRPDIVHTHASKAGIIGRLAARAAQVPIIIHGVHILPFVNVSARKAWVYTQLERWVGRFTDAFFDVGIGMRDACLAAKVGLPEQHHLVPSGMDIERYRKAAQNPPDWRTVLAGHAITPTDPQFITLASILEVRKRQVAFLPVFARLAARNPNAVLLLVGDGQERQKLAQRIKDLQLEGRVVLTGYRRDIEQILAISHIGLMTSEREGLSRAVIQYLLAGCPTVSTFVTGIDEVTTDGVNGFLTDLYDLEALIAPLERLLNDPALYQRMHQATLCADYARWDNRVMVEMMEDLYRKVYSEKHGHPPPAGASSKA